VLLRAKSTDDGSAERCQKKYVVAYQYIREDYIRLVIPLNNNCKIQSSERYDSSEGRELTASFARLRTIINDNGRNFVLHGSKTSGQ